MLPRLTHPIVDTKTLNIRVVNALYVEAMVLSDEARAYFDNFGLSDRDTLTPIQRVSFSCESLKVTTRLMQVIAWLLTQRGIAAGEICYDLSASRFLRLGEVNESDQTTLSSLPCDARELVEASANLFLRVKRLDEQLSETGSSQNRPQELRDRLASAF